MGDKTPLQVIVRVRVPFKHKGEENCIESAPGVGTRVAIPPTFDHKYHLVLGPETTQHDAFVNCGLPVLDAVFAGKNACVFAYGEAPPAMHRSSGLCSTASLGGGLDGHLLQLRP